MSEASTKPDAGGSDRQPIWASPARGSRGPAPAHSRGTIVATAVALADAQGIAAVSMRAVATGLDTSAGSLYRYLSSRDDLVDLMIDRVVGELRPYPQADSGWLDTMLLLARQQLALHRRHPWLLDVMQRSTGIGPERLAWFDNCLRILQPLRRPVTAKFEAIAMMTGVVSLIARREATTQTLTFIGVDLAGYPNLAAAFTQPSAPASHQDLFDRTLRALLTGLLIADPPEPAWPSEVRPRAAG